MKNKLTFLIAIFVLTISVLGCSSLNPLSGDSSDSSSSSKTGEKDKTLTDRAVDTAVGEETTGVPECDELFAIFDKEMKDDEAGAIAKAMKQTIYNGIKSSIRKSIEENQTDKEELAKRCVEFKQEYEEQKVKEAEKNNE